MHSPPQLLTVEEVAERLSVSRSLVYSLVESGKIISYRIGRGRGAIRVSETDLEAYLAGCRVEPERPRRTAPKARLKHIKL